MTTPERLPRQSLTPNSSKGILQIIQILHDLHPPPQHLLPPKTLRLIIQHHLLLDETQALLILPDISINISICQSWKTTRKQK
jgi:hypothetical protein